MATQEWESGYDAGIGVGLGYAVDILDDLIALMPDSPSLKLARTSVHSKHKTQELERSLDKANAELFKYRMAEREKHAT